jgi:hypothetical protein
LGTNLRHYLFISNEIFLIIEIKLSIHLSKRQKSRRRFSSSSVLLDPSYFISASASPSIKCFEISTSRTQNG